MADVVLGQITTTTTTTLGRQSAISEKKSGSTNSNDYGVGRSREGAQRGDGGRGTGEEEERNE